MLTEFWQRSRARQRRILSEVGQIELAVERENPRKSPEIIRDSPNKLARVLIVCVAAIIILIGINWFLLRTP
jgi:hypothetical protein